MYKIGEFSKLSQLTVRALRHYESLGLLVPERIDAETHYRYYSSQKLMIAHKIKTLQSVGLTLSDIKEIVDNSDQEILYLNHREKELNDELLDIQRQIETVKSIRSIQKTKLK